MCTYQWCYVHDRDSQTVMHACMHIHVHVDAHAHTHSCSHIHICTLYVLFLYINNRDHIIIIINTCIRTCTSTSASDLHALAHVHMCTADKFMQCFILVQHVFELSNKYTLQMFMHTHSEYSQGQLMQDYI